MVHITEVNINKYHETKKKYQWTKIQYINFIFFIKIYMFRLLCLVSFERKLDQFYQSLKKFSKRLWIVVKRFHFFSLSYICKVNILLALIFNKQKSVCTTLCGGLVTHVSMCMWSCEESIISSSCFFRLLATVWMALVHSSLQQQQQWTCKKHFFLYYNYCWFWQIGCDIPL